MSIDTQPDLTVARRVLQAADTDIAAFFDFFTDDTRFRMGNADPVVGREQIIAWVGSYLGSVAGLRHDVIEELYGADVAMLRVEVTYTMQNGTSFTLPAITRTRIRGDKIVEYLIFMDPSPVEAASHPHRTSN
jgi:hypothetical protein